MLVVPLVQRRLGFSTTALVGTAIASGAILTSAAARSLWLLILTLGAVYGFGQGFIYNSCVVVAQSWYPTRRGLIGGLVLAVFAASGFLYNVVSPLVANPNGVPTRAPSTNTTEAEAWAEVFNREMTAHVPKLLLLFGSTIAVLGVLGSLLLHSSPASDPRRAQPAPPQSTPAMAPEVPLDEMTKTSMDFSHPGGDELRKQFIAKKKQLRAPGNDFGPLAMLRTPQFYILYVAYTFGVTATVLVLGSFSDFARREASFSVPFSIVGGLAALCNAAGRVLWGALADAIDYRRTLVLVLTIVTGLLFGYYETKVTLIGWSVVTCAIWFCYGGILALLPTCVADAFGARNQARNYGIIYTSLAIGSLVQALMLTTLLEVLGSYRALFYICGALAGIAAFLMVAYKPPLKGKWFALHLSYARN
jgi:MFS family permease